MEKEHVTRPKLCLPVSRRINTLVREGNNGFSSKSSRGDAESSSPKYFTRTKMGEKRIKLDDFMFYKYVLTNPQHWNSLRNGWYQFTPHGSGNSSHCGLHTILECDKHIYGCLYEPQTTLGHIACITGDSAPGPAGTNHAGVEFNLEVSLKHMKSANIGSGIIFGFKNIFSFCMLICDVGNRSWELVLVQDEQYQVVREYADSGLKENIFQNVLLQIRNDCISVDVNGKGIFTSVRMQATSTHNEPLNGLLGVVVMKQSKVIMKGWKITRPTGTPAGLGISSAYSNGVSNKSSTLSTGATLTASSGAKPGLVQASAPATVTSRRPKTLAEMMAERNSTSIISAGTLPEPAPVPRTVLRLGTPPVPYGGGGPSSTNLATNSSFAYSTDALSSNATINGSIYRTDREVSGQYDAAVASAREAIRALYDEDLRHTEDGEGTTSSGDRDGDRQDSSASVALSPSTDATSLQQLRLHLQGMMHSPEILDSVLRDIILPSSISVTFQDIGALTQAKQILQEAVILPVLLPELFVGLREPWKGVLLFGPPGTGKTLLAKAVASLSSSTFINCSAATILCKYRGDSEKTIRCLFDAARTCTPSILFIDEIDGLVGHKSSQNSEHEATRRLKTEFFIQMDGLNTAVKSTVTGSSVVPNSKSNSVLVLATTNCPWELDDPIRRRMEKRIYIALPDEDARKDIFRLYLAKMKSDEEDGTGYVDNLGNIDAPESQSQCDLSPGDLVTLAGLSAGYSGADIYNVCREASMVPLRRLMQSVPNPMDLARLKAQGKIVVPKITLDDFKLALGSTKPSVSQQGYLYKFEQFDKEFGSH